MWPAGTVTISAASSRSKRADGITILAMWTWIKRHRAARENLAAENLQLRSLVAQLAEENVTLRALACNLDAAVLDLSQQLWGPEAVARVLDQARRNGNN
jgi:hypothetical protein